MSDIKKINKDGGKQGHMETFIFTLLFQFEESRDNVRQRKRQKQNLVIDFFLQKMNQTYEIC